MNTQLNSSDKNGLAPCFGFSDTTGTSASNVGHIINGSAPNQLVFEYAIPLIGILGCSTSKMIPTGAFQSLRYELTLDDYTKFTTNLSSTTFKLTSCVLSDLEFVGQVVELENDAQSLIEAQHPNKIHIRTQSYRTSTNTLPSTSLGLVDLLIGARVSSLKSIFISCSPSDAAEGKFASVCPNATQGTCVVLGGGLQIPQRTISPVTKPADAYCELLKANGALSSVSFNGAINKAGYYVASSATGLCTAYNKTKTSMYTSPSMHITGFNTEIISHRNSLLSGINVNSSPSFYRLQISSDIMVQHSLYFFLYHDVILEIDPFAKTIVSKF